MSRNLAFSRGAIVSEAVMMGLGKTIGRQCKYVRVFCPLV
jgi:3-carboxy-cis,cis-muconate cycloisomerase